jgi:signal peptidase II
MKLLGLWLLAAGVAILDQASKYYVWTHFQLHESRPAWGTWFSWTYCHNDGGAFSILSGSRWFFLGAGVLIAGYLTYSMGKVSRGPWLPAVAQALLLGGAIGNLIDRSLYGYVVDFIDFHFWPVFNLADSAITVGISVLALSLAFEKPEASLQGEKSY